MLSYTTFHLYKVVTSVKNNFWYITTYAQINDVQPCFAFNNTGRMQQQNSCSLFFYNLATLSLADYCGCYK